MVPKLLAWLLGKKARSTLIGIASSSVTGAAAVAATGNLSKEALVVGAVGGAVSSVLAIRGRTHGEG